jgi:hypothetical protein
METNLLHGELQEVFRDIVEGKVVKRSRHELKWGIRDVTTEFIDTLGKAGYKQMLVQDLDVEPGERVPAFYIEDSVAYFGWVFWEKFSQLKLRKLFGSVVRNSKGDWAVQISEKRRSVIYANSSLKSDMDIENPSGF